MNFDAEIYMDAAAQAVGLAISAGQRPGVIRFLQVAQHMAERVAAAPIPSDTIDLAPVFVPGEKAVPSA